MRTFTDAELLDAQQTHKIALQYVPRDPHADRGRESDPHHADHWWATPMMGPYRGYSYRGATPREALVMAAEYVMQPAAPAGV